MSRYRSQGLLAVGLGLAATACGQPDLNTNLRPAGPPDVLAVLTQNPLDLDGNSLTETALRCKYVGGKRDPKAPGFVGDPITGGSLICPDNETDFHAATVDPRILDDAPWAIRVMFDELLDGDKVETLDCDEESGVCAGTLAETRPVTLKCGTVEIRYFNDPADDPDLQARDRNRSYYVPNGNSVTFPVGPSLYISPKPEELVFPTGSSCSLTIDPARVTDKDGNAVPADDLSTPFSIADLAVILIDPADSTPAATISPDPAAAGAVVFVFNASLDDAEVDPAAFELKDEGGLALPTAIFVDTYNVGTDAVYMIPDTATGIFLPGGYTGTMKPTELTEVNGGTLTTTADTATHFSVAFAKTGQTSGTDLATNGFIRVSFNNTLDPTTVDTNVATGTDLELFQTNPPTNPVNGPVAATVTVGNSAAAFANVANNAIIITPNAELPIGTYVVRIKGGAAFKDTAATPHEAKFATPLAITYNVLLKSTHSIPANAGSLVAAPVAGCVEPAACGNFDIVFSGSLDFAPTSIDASDFTLVDTTNMMAVPFAVSMATSVSRPPPAPGSHANDTVRINPSANLTVGRMYQLTIKQGAAIKSANGVTRTFGAPSTSGTNRTTWTFTAT